MLLENSPHLMKLLHPVYSCCSKITNLFSAYKDAGILHLLKYMKDTDNEADWTDLVSLSNIETAAKNIKRLALALHLALFLRSLHNDALYLHVVQM
jgi:hypothetical protein